MMIGKIYSKIKNIVYKSKKVEPEEDKDSFLAFGETLFNVPGAFTVSKKEDGADCYES
jgi:hypothetical protein